MSSTPFWKRHEVVLLFVVIAEWLFFHSVGPRFGQWDNTCVILSHSCEIGLLALVMTPIILTGGIDLSVGSLLGLSAIVFGKCIRDFGMSVPAAIVVTLLTGMLGGGLNAILITFFRLPPLIVTLGSWSLFRGFAEAITLGVDTFSQFPSSFLFWGQERWLGVPAQVPFLMLASVLVWIWVHQTTQGRALRAIGFSPEGARFAGLPVGKQLATVYVVAGLAASVAGLIYTARVGQAKADAGMGYELYAITAVVLGGTRIFGGVGTVHGTLLGVAAIAILGSGLFHARQPREVAGMMTGVLLILALVAGSLSQWNFRGKLFRRKGNGNENEKSAVKVM